MKSNFTVNIDTIQFSVRGIMFDIPNAKIFGRLSPDRTRVEGQYSNRVSIQGRHGMHNLNVATRDFQQELLVEGTVGGFLLGQNLFTSSDLTLLCMTALKKIFKHFNWYAGYENRNRWLRGDIDLERVDLACNFQLDSEADVARLLNYLRWRLPASLACLRFYQTSAYWAPDDGNDHQILFYAKGAEMRKRPSLKKSPIADVLLKESERIIRVEIQLKGALRRLGLQKLAAWDENTPETLFRSIFGKLDFPEMIVGPVTRTELEALPRALRPVWANFKAGSSLEDIYGPRTLQRFRRAFKALGYDIKCPHRPVAEFTAAKKVLSLDNVMELPNWVPKLDCE